LTELVLGDAVWRKSTFETLEPLAALLDLRRLMLHPKRIDDGRIQPLSRLSGLERLSIPTNLFTTEQIAWLRARLSESLDCEALTGLVNLPKPIGRAGKPVDVLLVGKRKPFLNSKLDAVRIQHHVNEFNQMVETFKSDPSLEPS
jgi:hypothetical protein